MDSVTPIVDPITQRTSDPVSHTLRGNWELDVLLEVGAIAGVYTATHRNGKRVATKTVHSELSSLTSAIGLPR